MIAAMIHIDEMNWKETVVILMTERRGAGAGAEQDLHEVAIMTDLDFEIQNLVYLTQDGVEGGEVCLPGVLLKHNYSVRNSTSGSSRNFLISFSNGRCHYNIIECCHGLISYCSDEPQLIEMENFICIYSLIMLMNHYFFAPISLANPQSVSVSPQFF